MVDSAPAPASFRMDLRFIARLPWLRGELSGPASILRKRKFCAALPNNPHDRQALNLRITSIAKAHIAGVADQAEHRLVDPGIDEIAQPPQAMLGRAGDAEGLDRLVGNEARRRP